jgi:fructoselysine-6-P-deglycase FrlB-like protein
MTDKKLTGLELIRQEMSMQHADALASLDANNVIMRRIAEALETKKRLVLLGMGGSHFANRSAEVEYKKLGLDATALLISEVLYYPLPDCARVSLIASQSGESGEILHYLKKPKGQEERFGLTLNAESTLAKSVPSLVGVGGPELGFAATRSMMISLALHAVILESLGASQENVRAVLKHPPLPDVSKAIETLSNLETSNLETIAFVGRGTLQGIAEMGALAMTELGRITAIAYEGGAFRHGPLESLGPNLGVVFFRAHGETAQHTKELAEICLRTGMNPVVFDTSGEADIPNAVTIRLPTLEGLAAAMSILQPLQTLVLALASQRVKNVGEPVRSSKVTREG